MSLVKRNGHWILALFGAASLAWSAGAWAERQPALGPTTAKEQAEASRGVSDARELSAAFRRAAKEVMPGIVSIETRGRANHVGRNQDQDEGDSPFGENSPFGDMFRNDPRSKEYFKRRPQGRSEMPRTQGMGSGFIIDPSGIVLTNNHVVQNADEVKVKLPDGREFIGTDIKTDPRTDVAIVRIKSDEPLPALKLGNSEAIEVGEWVLAVGSPFGLDLTVTAGIISAKGRGPGITEREDFLQTDAAINPGNSGGPLLNLNGEVVGINTAISTRSGGYDGVGFAVPINMARWVAEQLIHKGNVSRAYLGVQIQPVDNKLARKLNVPVGHGALVTEVMPNSPAEAAKVEAGDLIVKLDGKDVHTTRGLQGIVEQLEIGSSYKLVVRRDDKEVTLNLQMKEMPKHFARASFNPQSDEEEKETPAPAPENHDEIGLGVGELSADVAKQFGYKAGTGVLVKSVKEDSPAAAAGLQEGFLIEKVGNVKVTTPAEFKDAVKNASLEKGLLLLVRSPRGGTQFVVVQMDKATK